MDGASAAAAIIAIATAGIQVSIRLVTISAQISTASERVSAIGNDVSLTASILQQLGDLIKQDATDSHGRVFNQGGLDSIQRSAFVCQRVFIEITKEIGKASVQLRNCERLAGGKVKLSKIEMARWPFVQPSINALRDDLKEAKGTLMLMLQLWLLAIARRTAEFNNTVSSNIVEQRDMMRAIIALKVQPQLEARQDDVTTAQDIYQRLDEEVPQPKDMTTDGVALIQAMPALPLTARQEQGEVPGNETSPAELQAIEAPSKSPDHIDTNSDKEVYYGLESNRAERGSTALSLSTVLRSTNIERTNSALPEEVSPRNPSLISVRTSDPININTQDGDPSELSLFQVKAVVRDNMVDSKGGIPSIELIWHVQNLRLEQSVIRDHLTQLKSQGRYSIIEVIDSLYDHERYMLDRVLKATTDRPEGTAIALTRTKADIQFRGMTFRQVPGLQLVMQRNLSPKPGIRTMLRSTMIRVRDWHPLPYRKERIPASSSIGAATQAPGMDVLSFSNSVPLTQANIASISQQAYSEVLPSESASQINVPESSSEILSYAGSTEGLQTSPPAYDLNACSDISSHREQYSGLRPSPNHPTGPAAFPHLSMASMPAATTPRMSFFEPPKIEVSMMQDDEASVVDDLLKNYTTLFDKHDQSESDERSRWNSRPRPYILT